MTGKRERIEKYENFISKMLEGKPDYLCGYYNYIKTNKTITTAYNYLRYIVKFMEKHNYNLSELNYDSFLNYVAESEFKKGNIPTTPSYRIAVYSALKTFSEYLYISEKTRDDYMKKIKRPKFYETQQTVQKRSRAYLTSDEVKRAISMFRDDIRYAESQYQEEHYKRDLAIIELFLTTGMRRSALIDLDLEDIDFKKRKIFITDKGQKTNEFNIANSVCKLITEWLKIRKKWLSEKENGDKEQALFITKTYLTRADEKSIANAVKHFGKNIGRDDLSPHKLRATYGTELYNQTKDIYFVQKCMDHSSVNTTTLYIRDNDHIKDEATSIVCESLGI